MNLVNVFYAVAALMGLLGVIAGAVGAHMVQPGLSDIDAATYDTAIVYLFVHVLALMFVATLIKMGRESWSLKLAGTAFLFGTPLFSMTILSRLIFEFRAPSLFAPTGGTLLMLAWAALIVAALSE